MVNAKWSRSAGFQRLGPQDGAGACVPRQNLSHRALARGDVINTEISVSYWGYSGQAHRPVFLKAQPSDLYRQLWDTALEAYQRCMACLKPGATSEDVLDAIADFQRMAREKGVNLSAVFAPDPTVINTAGDPNANP